MEFSRMTGGIRCVCMCVEGAVGADGWWRQNALGVGDLLSLHSVLCSILCAAAAAAVLRL